MKLIDADAAMEYLTNRAMEEEEPWLTSAMTAICRFLDAQPAVEIKETKLYTTEELYPNCTVQIWKTDSGDVSVGWWENS